MPPPKKPKTGPTSIDQFLSNEEQIIRYGYIRDRSWSYSSRESTDSIRYRSGSFSGESDIRDRTGSYSGESDISRESPRQSLDSDCSTYSTDVRASGLKLLRELIIKKKEPEEQKVPQSNLDDQSPTSGHVSPTDSNVLDKQTDSSLKCPLDKVDQAEKIDKPDKPDRQLSPNPLPPAASSPDPVPQATVSPDPGTPVTETRIPSIEQKIKVQEKHYSTPAVSKKSDDKLRKSLVASSLMTSRANGMSMSTMPTYISPYLYGHSPLLSSMFPKGMDSEPRDLSRKVPKTETGLSDSRYYNGLSYGLSDTSLQSYMNFSLNPYDTIPSTDEKQYLNARKNLVGMIKEPRFSHTGHVGFPTPPAEKDVSFGGAFPFFVNGFDLQRYVYI